MLGEANIRDVYRRAIQVTRPPGSDTLGWINPVIGSPVAGRIEPPPVGSVGTNWAEAGREARAKSTATRRTRLNARIATSGFGLNCARPITRDMPRGVGAAEMI
jgi:hypothetical protein